MSTLTAEPVSVSSEFASLLSLISSVEDAVGSPPDFSEINRLRVQCIETIAQFPVGRKDSASVAAACRLVETVLNAGWNDPPAPAEVVAEAERASGQGWTGLLAALLLAPAWQLKSLPSFETAPLFLWRTLAIACFRLPAGLIALGQSDALAAQQLLRLRELARLAKNNAGSSALRAAVEVCLKVGDRRLLASSAHSLAENLILRGQLRSAVQRRTGALPPAALPRAGRWLRVGVVIQDLANTRQLRSALPWFEALDPTRFEVIVFFTGGSDGWGETCLTERDIAFRPLLGEPSAHNGQLQSECLDIALFALDSFGPADPIPVLLSERVAPLQGTLDEFGFTSGLAGLDIVFRRTAAGGAASASERLLVVPSAGVRLFPAGSLGQARQSWDRAGLGFPEDAVVFSSAAPFALLSPEWTDQAVRILRDLPEARLLIHSGAPEDAGPSGLARLCAMIEPALARYQVGAERLMLSNEPLAHLAEVGALLSLADVHLDSYPLGDAEGCHLALAAGVPVLAVSEALQLAATPELRAELSQSLSLNLASPRAFHDPLAFAESVGAMLEQVFDLAAADDSGAVFRGQPPLEIKTGPIPAGALEEAGLRLEAGLAAEALPRVALWFAADPVDSKVRTLYYSALIQGGQARRALFGLTAALDRQVAEAETWRLAARARLFLGQNEEATMAMRSSLKIDSKHPETWAVLSEMATAGGHLELIEEIGRLRSALGAPGTEEIPAANRSGD